MFDPNKMLRVKIIVLMTLNTTNTYIPNSDFESGKKKKNVAVPISWHKLCTKDKKVCKTLNLFFP